MTELFTVLENGQLEVNFEALELITDSAFVDSINFQISEGAKVVSIRESRLDVEVLVIWDGIVGQYIYEKYRGKFTLRWFNKYDLERLMEVIKNV